MADAFLGKYALLSVLEAKVGFSLNSGTLQGGSRFQGVLARMPIDNPYTIQEGYLFKSKLYIPRSPLRELLVQEAHDGALGGHLGLNKTIDIRQQHI